MKTYSNHARAYRDTPLQEMYVVICGGMEKSKSRKGDRHHSHRSGANNSRDTPLHGNFVVDCRGMRLP